MDNIVKVASGWTHPRFPGRIFANKQALITILADITIDDPALVPGYIASIQKLFAQIMERQSSEYEYERDIAVGYAKSAARLLANVEDDMLNLLKNIDKARQMAINTKEEQESSKAGGEQTIV